MKKSLWKWPDVTLPQCLPPHNCCSLRGARHTQAEYSPNYSRKVGKSWEKQRPSAGRERGGGVGLLPRWVRAPGRDGSSPGLHVKGTNAALETFWWVNFFFLHVCIECGFACRRVHVTSFLSNFEQAQRLWRIGVREARVVVNMSVLSEPLLTCCCGRVQPNRASSAGCRCAWRLITFEVQAKASSDIWSSGTRLRRTRGGSSSSSVHARARAIVVFCWCITRVNSLICDVSPKAALRVNAHAASDPMLCRAFSRARARVCERTLSFGSG